MPACSPTSYYDGACADHVVDASQSHERIVPPAVRCQDFQSAADMSKAVLNIILDADPKHLSPT
jgi:hypothetical protein